MNKTTTKQLRDIVKTIKVKKFNGPYKYVHTVSPELQAAIKDTAGFEKYLEEMCPDRGETVKNLTLMRNKTLLPVFTVLCVIAQIPCGILLDFSLYWLVNMVITAVVCIYSVYISSNYHYGT